MFGFINVYKPSGMTSHGVISVLRRVLKIKKIGHSGTLDPLAYGVLPVAVGDAARLIEYLKDDKEYLAEIKFGESTTTYDTEGEITFKTDKIVEFSELESCLDTFRGEILQKPPIYSAVKKNGKKLYEYARKGIETEIEERKVFIEKLEFLSLNDNIAEVLIKCSKGTYIRSIANDLGEVLNTGAHLKKLVRIKAGDFEIDNSVKLEDIEKSENAVELIESPEKYLSHIKSVQIDENELQKVKYGQNFSSVKFTNCNNELIILLHCNKIVAVARVFDNKTILQKVFVR